MLRDAQVKIKKFTCFKIIIHIHVYGVVVFGMSHSVYHGINRNKSLHSKKKSIEINLFEGFTYLGRHHQCTVHGCAQSSRQKAKVIQYNTAPEY